MLGDELLTSVNTCVCEQGDSMASISTLWELVNNLPFVLMAGRTERSRGDPLVAWPVIPGMKVRTWFLEWVVHWHGIDGKIGIISRWLSLAGKSEDSSCAFRRKAEWLTGRCWIFVSQVTGFNWSAAFGSAFFVAVMIIHLLGSYSWRQISNVKVPLAVRKACL